MELLTAMLSSVFACSKDLMSKRLAFHLDGTVSTFASFTFALPFYLVLLTVLSLLGHEVFTVSLAFLALVFLRSVTDTFAEWLKMHALAHGDLSVVVLVLSLSPLFLLITSPVITGDRLTIVEVIALFLVVLGSILMVYRPSARLSAGHTKGLLLAAGAALFFSLNGCFDRLAIAKAKGTPVFSGFAMTFLSAVFLLPLVLGNKDRVNALRRHRGGFLLRGLLETAFMVCKLSALQTLDAPTMAGIQRLSLLLAIIGGRVFFKEEDFRRKLAAGLLIAAGVILIIGWQLWKHSHPAG
jgi:drug/metabolite transporter (DMT)-like permease